MGIVLIRYRKVPIMSLLGRQLPLVRMGGAGREGVVTYVGIC